MQRKTQEKHIQRKVQDKKKKETGKNRLQKD